jgi:hypothetical protein
MYFWRIHSLKADLRRGDLPEQRAFAYLLATMALFTFISNPELAENQSPAAWNWGTTLVYIAIVLAGTVAAYRANGGASGRQFLARYFALGWVLGIRLTAFLLIPLMLIYGVVALTSGEQSTAAALVLLGCTSLWSVVFYARLAVHMREVAAGGAPSPQAAV